jgi:hypothetical protein
LPSDDDDPGHRVLLGPVKASDYPDAGILRERSFKTDGAFHDRTVMSVSHEEYPVARERFDRRAVGNTSS